MFRAFDSDRSEDINFLEFYREDADINALREKGRREILLCPVCREPVIVKAGEKRRWHFAHRVAGTCILQHEHPDILIARSILFEWLNSKYPGKVIIEKHFPDHRLPRVMDCFVERKKEFPFTYWILRSGISDRDRVRFFLRRITPYFHWLFLSNMIRLDNFGHNRIHLNPTEREFLRDSRYSLGVGKSIHYLDIESEKITTFRGLILDHGPRTFGFRKKQASKLEDMMISPKTGELVHPGEHEELREYEQKISKQKTEATRHRGVGKEKAENNGPASGPIRNDRPSEFGGGGLSGGRSSSKNQKVSMGLTPVPCEKCGSLTTDWYSYDSGSGQCLCRDCAYA